MQATTHSTAAHRSYRKALLVDDDEISLNLTHITLESLGLTEVVVAQDGGAALRLFDRMAVKPDLVVCDLYMPEMDGIEFINALGERQYRGAIVLMTAGDLGIMDIAMKVATRAHGLCLLGAFAKPVREADLARALEPPGALCGS